MVTKLRHVLMTSVLKVGVCFSDLDAVMWIMTDEEENQTEIMTEREILDRRCLY